MCRALIGSTFGPRLALASTPLLAATCLAFAHPLGDLQGLIVDAGGWAIIVNAIGVLVAVVVAIRLRGESLTIAALGRVPSLLVCFLAVTATVASLSRVPDLVQHARLADRDILLLEAAAQASVFGQRASVMG